jgi:hypothetical protein
VFQGVSQYFPSVSLLYFGLFNPFHCSPLLFYLSPPIFNGFHYISLYPLPTRMSFFILLMFYHSFFLSLLSESSSTITNMFYIWVCIWSCLILCICLSFNSVFHVWEKTCSLCIAEPGLLHLTWYSPLTFQPHVILSYGWIKLLCIYTTISWPIHQLQGIWVVSIAWLLWRVLWWTSGYKCLYCILT